MNSTKQVNTNSHPMLPLFVVFLLTLISMASSQTIYQNLLWYNGQSCGGNIVSTTNVQSGLCIPNDNPSIPGNYNKIVCAAVGSSSTTFNACQDSLCANCTEMTIPNSCGGFNDLFAFNSTLEGMSFSASCTTAFVEAGPVIISPVFYNTSTCVPGQTQVSTYPLNTCIGAGQFVCNNATSLTLINYNDLACTSFAGNVTFGAEECNADILEGQFVSIPSACTAASNTISTSSGATSTSSTSSSSSAGTTTTAGKPTSGSSSIFPFGSIFTLLVVLLFLVL